MTDTWTLTPQSAQPLRVHGWLDHFAFGFCAYFQGLLLAPPMGLDAPRVWPRYRALTRPLRQALYITPLANNMQATLDERIAEETQARYVEVLKGEVERIEAEETVS